MASADLRIPAFMRKKKLAKKAGKSSIKKIKNLPKKKIKKIVKKVKKVKALKRKIPAVIKKTKQLKPKGKPVGKITHFYDKISVAVLKLNNTLKVGDKLNLVGKDGEFKQLIRSIQIEHEQVPVAKKGADIGIKVDKPVKVDKTAYLL